MRARIAFPLLILVVLAAMAVQRPAAAGPWALGPREWYADLEGSTFTANTFHAGEGSRADTGLVVEQRALRSVVEVGWTRRINLVFGLPMLSVTNRDAQVQGTATGFQDVSVGLRYNLMSAASAASISVGWNAPAGYNRKLDSLGLDLGEGLQELTGQLDLGTALKDKGFVQGSIGYGYRYLGVGERESGPVAPGDIHYAKYLWSNRLHMSADLALWFGGNWLASGRYRGDMTLAHGALAQDEDVHLMGAALHHRFDERLDMFAGFWSTASGKNTLHYDQVYLGLAFHRSTLKRLQGYLGGTAP